MAILNAIGLNNKNILSKINIFLLICLLIIMLFQSPGAGEKGSAIDLDLGPPIDEHAARNYRTIKAVSWLLFAVKIFAMYITF